MSLQFISNWFEELLLTRNDAAKASLTQNNKYIKQILLLAIMWVNITEHSLLPKPFINPSVLIKIFYFLPKTQLPVFSNPSFVLFGNAFAGVHISAPPPTAGFQKSLNTGLAWERRDRREKCWPRNLQPPTETQRRTDAALRRGFVSEIVLISRVGSEIHIWRCSASYLASALFWPARSLVAIW